MKPIQEKLWNDLLECHRLEQEIMRELFKIEEERLRIRKELFESIKEVEDEPI